MANEEYKYLGGNIKALRNAYGETILDLALALGMDSASAITNWEKGTRIPNRESIKRIAEHYLITEDELKYDDLSNINLTNLRLSEVDRMREAAKVTFPMISSEEALENDSDFREGYKLHEELLSDLMNGYPLDDRFERCMSYYEKSINALGTPESAANMLWGIFVVGTQLINSRVSMGAGLLSKGKITEKDFLKNYWLEDCSEELSDDPDDELMLAKKEFLESTEDIIIELIAQLKQSDYSALAEYYTALRFMIGLINNGKSYRRNKSVGEDLMVELVQTGNKYAIEYLKISMP